MEVMNERATPPLEYKAFAVALAGYAYKLVQNFNPTKIG